MAATEPPLYLELLQMIVSLVSWGFLSQVKQHIGKKAFKRNTRKYFVIIITKHYPDVWYI